MNVFLPRKLKKVVEKRCRYCHEVLYTPNPYHKYASRCRSCMTKKQMRDYPLPISALKYAGSRRCKANKEK